jgi:hypothetical protein
MSKKILVHLRAFDGDDAFFVVGQATFEWFNAPRPAAFDKGKTSYNEKIPAAVLAEATNPDANSAKTVCVTSGSCENDRAIHAMSLFTVTDTPPSGKYDGFYDGMIY